MTRNTKLFTVTDVKRDHPALLEAASALREGALVVFPTETVYGIGANALDKQAIHGIFAAKGRPQDNPLIVHISDWEDITPLVTEIPRQARLLAERFWPGPLTMILPKSGAIPDVVSAGLPTVAVRMPSHPVARELIRLAGVPVAAPSANLSGSPSPTTASHCVSDLNGRVDYILDGGSSHVGVESTVITLAGDMPRLLRPGAVTPGQLRDILGDVEVDDAVFRQLDQDGPVASPGMKYKHYAPRARVWMVHGGLEEYLGLLREKEGSGVYALAFDGDRDRIDMPCVTYGREHDPESQAERLFAALRKLDELGAEQVYARAPDRDGLGLAVYNRLLRAAAFAEIYVS